MKEIVTNWIIFFTSMKVHLHRSMVLLNNDSSYHKTYLYSAFCSMISKNRILMAFFKEELMLIVHSYDVSTTIIIPDCSAFVLWSDVLFYGLDYRKKIIWQSHLHSKLPLTKFNSLSTSFNMAVNWRQLFFYSS